jgi:DNA-binding transcriptional regulator YbjK
VETDSTKGKDMSEDDRITIIAESFEAAALEFHRRNLASEGYRMVGPISLQRFERMNGPQREVLFDGNPMFAVTFAKGGN